LPKCIKPWSNQYGRLGQIFLEFLESCLASWGPHEEILLLENLEEREPPDS
jgi:hypothetical protein